MTGYVCQSGHTYHKVIVCQRFCLVFEELGIFFPDGSVKIAELDLCEAP